MTVFLPDPGLLDSPRGRPWPTLPAGARGQAGPPPVAADVVVVGAGPAGLAVCCALWHHGVRDVVVLDRDGGCATRFLRRTDRLGQRVLRSPYEHHPGVEGYRDCELLDFARLHWARLTPTERREIRMAQSGQRSVVPLDVFEVYCRHLAVTHGVTDRSWQAEVAAVEPHDDGVRVVTDRGTTEAGFVVLCTGEERRAAPETWWGGGRPPAGVRYWDDPPPDAGAEHVAVVGAGLSAAHRVATALDAGAQVTWTVRAAREHYQCADVNASFFRPEGRARFGLGDRAGRLAMLAEHRRPSVMFEFRPGLEAAERAGQLIVLRGVEVGSVVGPSVRLTDGRRVGADQVELALGTVPNGIAGGRHLLAPDLGLADDGWPDLDPRTLAYVRAPRVHAVGAPTAVALGPAARNLDGHRVATARVAAAVAHGLDRGAPLTDEPLVAAGG